MQSTKIATTGASQLTPVGPIRIGDGLWLLFGAVKSAIYDLVQEELLRVENGTALFLVSLASLPQEEAHIALERLVPELWDSLSGHSLFDRLFVGGEELLEENASHLEIVWLEITDRCNLECVHCYLSAGPRNRKELTVEQVRGFLRFLPLPPLRIQLIGGEPFLHSGVWAIIETCEYLFPAAKIEVFSNLLTLEASDLYRVKEHSISLATSLYGSCGEVHDLITRHEGSFKKLVSVLTLLKLQSIPCRIALVRVPQNEQDINQAAALARSFGGTISCEGYWDDARPVGRGVATQVSKSQPFTLNLSPTKARFSANLSGHPCWGRRLALASDGGVLPCVFCRNTIVNPGPEGYAKLISVHSRLASQTKLENVEKCRVCEFRLACFDCRALSLAASGSLTGPPVRCDYDPQTGAIDHLSHTLDC